MTIHFAAAADRRPTGLGLAQARVALGQPANDNPIDINQETLLHAALRHFAQFGLGAAAQAREQAEQAFFAGDRETYRRWLAICRILDSRMAAGLARRRSRPKAPAETSGTQG